MKKLTASEIRNMWLKFFEERGHKVEKGSSLIPYDDPTLLWINSGVAALKKYFNGTIIPENPRIVNSQRAIRTNDIEKVGRTARHHTLFEMLGNFSIGDYFRDEVLTWAMELLTSKKWFGLDKNRLYMTVYPNDTETIEKWISLGVDRTHLIPLESNFWEIGEGPCGPCTEIFYDRGEKYDPDNLGIKLLKEDIDNDRYVEIWNIVFSTYNSVPSLKREDYPELPHKNIDTGMGLERIVSIIQNAETNFDTDLFLPIIREIEKYTNIKYEGQMPFKVVSDHIRAITFAISDGATFSNEGRGYILRRLLRRASLHARKLNINENFLSKLVPTVVKIMEDFYPHLKEKEALVQELVEKEEIQFSKTILNGEKLLEDLLKDSSKMISGIDAFKLYDTYGFPIELTIEYAEDAGFVVDLKGFEEEMNKQKTKARMSRETLESMKVQNELLMDYKEESTFVGYETLNKKTKVLAILENDEFKEKMEKEEIIILKETPFYAESGGQVADTGIISNENFKGEVTNTIKAPNGQHMHFVKVIKGTLKKGDIVNATVDEKRRKQIMRNHSATHLLQYALQKVLGKDVTQAGSSVDEKRLRFDFTYVKEISDKNILEIEKEVNKLILENHKQEINILPIEEAKEMGAIALFGEKYGDIVRVVRFGPSFEFCGGTHVISTGEIEKFAIKSLESKGSGVYRIEALTSSNVLEGLKEVTINFDIEIEKLINKGNSIISKAKENDIELNLLFDFDKTIKPTYETIIKRREMLDEIKIKIKDLEKEYLQKLSKKATSNLDKFLENVEEIYDFKTIITKLNNYEVGQVKELADALIEKIKPGFVFLANIKEESVTFVAKASKELVERGINCGELVKQASIICGGNGGGRADFAQAGGKDASKVDDALSEVKAKVLSL